MSPKARLRTSCSTNRACSSISKINLAKNWISSSNNLHFQIYQLPMLAPVSNIKNLWKIYNRIIRAKDLWLKHLFSIRVGWLSHWLRTDSFLSRQLALWKMTRTHRAINFCSLIKQICCKIIEMLKDSHNQVPKSNLSLQTNQIWVNLITRLPTKISKEMFRLHSIRKCSRPLKIRRIRITQRNWINFGTISMLIYSKILGQWACHHNNFWFRIHKRKMAYLDRHKLWAKIKMQINSMIRCSSKSVDKIKTPKIIHSTPKIYNNPTKFSSLCPNLTK